MSEVRAASIPITFARRLSISACSAVNFLGEFLAAFMGELTRLLYLCVVPFTNVMSRLDLILVIMVLSSLTLSIVAKIEGPFVLIV